MKIAIIGCGNQGSGMAGLLSREDDVEQLILVDIDINMAKRTVAHIGSLGEAAKVKDIEVRRVDASDESGIIECCAGADILFNATFPPFNIPIMKACLEIGSHYLDLYSHPFATDRIPHSETIDAQLELDAEFKQKELAAFPCLGINPGWEYLAAKYSMREMTEIESVISRDMDWTDSTELIAFVAPSVIFELFFDAPGMTYIENGNPKEIDLLASEEAYDFPDPIGRGVIYGLTSPQLSFLLNRFSEKPIGRIVEKFGIRNGGLEMKDIWIRALSKLSSEQQISKADLFELLGASFISDLDFKEAFDRGIVRDGAFASSIEVTGTRKGQTVRHTINLVTTLKTAMEYWPYGGHSVFNTVDGLTIVLLLMLGRGEVPVRGVLTLDSIADFDSVIERIRARGHHISERKEIIISEQEDGK